MIRPWFPFTDKVVNALDCGIGTLMVTEVSFEGGQLHSRDRAAALATAARRVGLLTLPTGVVLFCILLGLYAELALQALPVALWYFVNAVQVRCRCHPVSHQSDGGSRVLY